MLGNAHFYNRTIRKVVVAFGTLFNDIMLVRYNKAGTTEYERFKVPLSYGSKEKYITRITSDPSLTKSVNTVVPRISFEMTGMTYDSSRKQQSLFYGGPYSGIPHRQRLRTFHRSRRHRYFPRSARRHAPWRRMV